jgi:hypothetical protein
MISKHFYITNKHHRIVERREFPWKNLYLRKIHEIHQKKKAAALDKKKRAKKNREKIDMQSQP